MSTIYQIEPKIVNIFTTIVSTGPTHKYLRKHLLSSPLNRHIYLNQIDLPNRSADNSAAGAKSKQKRRILINV